MVFSGDTYSESFHAVWSDGPLSGKHVVGFISQTMLYYNTHVILGLNLIVHETVN